MIRGSDHDKKTSFELNYHNETKQPIHQTFQQYIHSETYKIKTHIFTYFILFNMNFIKTRWDYQK